MNNTSSSSSVKMSGQAIQIVTPLNHIFQLNSNDLQLFSNNSDLKDRQVVISSIAGAFRKEKSFLLNFFLKYLIAQVMYQNQCFQFYLNQFYLNL